MKADERREGRDGHAGEAGYHRAVGGWSEAAVEGGDALQMRPESGTFVREGATFAGAPYISARGLGLKTYAGYAYREVDVDVHKGELVAVRGRNGSGKTALLLTLAGRMKQTEGTLNVGEFELPRQRSKAERHVGLGLFSGLNDLQGQLDGGICVGSRVRAVRS